MQGNHISILFSTEQLWRCNGKRAVDHEFELRSGYTKDYTIGISCFSAKHTTLRSMSKDWLARNQNNVSAISTRGRVVSELAL